MNTNLVYSQIRDFRRHLNALENSIAELNNAIFLMEEKMFDYEDHYRKGDEDVFTTTYELER